MKKVLFLLFSILAFQINGFSQEKTVSGTVTSSEDGLSLPGVTIIINETSTGTVTDLDGKYTLSGVSPENILVFSYIGFDTKEVVIEAQSVINVSLDVAAAELDEVVVTALGIKRQKREIGYSTEKIDADAVVRSNAPNVLNAIIGRSAGVQVSQNDGVEGGSTRIIIRGNNNIDGNNQPLIVVDGVPMENTPGLMSIKSGVDWGSPINDVNPLDIAEYSVLKGGAASALYGSRGANGVILINTKRGKKNRGIGVTYNYTYKWIHPYRYREVQDVYGHGGPIALTPPILDTVDGVLQYPGIYGNDNLILNEDGDISSSVTEFGNYGSGVSWGPKMEGQMVEWWDGEMREYSQTPNYMMEPYNNGHTSTHNLSASGGGEKGTMRVSLTRQDHKPIIENSDFDRTTINVAGNLKVSDKVRIDLTASYIKYDRLNSPILGEDWKSFNKGYLYSWPTSYKAIDRENYAYADGSKNPQIGYPFLYVENDLWWRYYNNNTTLDRDKFYGALTLTYDVTKWLNFVGRAGIDYTIDQYETRHKPTDPIGLEGGFYGIKLSKNYGDNFDFILTANKDNIFNSRLNVKFTVGAARWDKNYYEMRGNSGEKWYYPNMYTFFNYSDDEYYTMELDSLLGIDSSIIVLQKPGDNRDTLRTGEYIENRRTKSVYSFLNLSWDDYLFLELTGRNDWSSTLPPESNSYFYPSFSLSFVATEAFPIQEKISWLNFIKIRGGIAQTASDADPYKTEFYYNTGRFGGQQSSYFPAVIPPLELKPQRVNAYEAGINLGFFENRIDFDFTYYYLYSFDQIITAPLPYSAGSGYIEINEGILTNKGFEIILYTVPVQTKNVLFRTGINFSRNRNYVKSLGDYADSYELADIWGLHGPAMILHEGDEFGTISGYDYVYHENGQPIVNEAGTHYEITDTRVPIGNASPDFLAGWYTELSYKGFTLGTLIDTKWGGDIYCGSYVIGLQTGQSPETLLEREGGGLSYTDPEGNTSNTGVILKGVYEDGTQNDQVVHYYYKYFAGGWGQRLSTTGIVENTWVKMREISLSYTFNPSLVRKSKVFQNLRLSIVGRDLFYIYSTLPDNINPEGLMGAGNAQGFEWASYPSSMSITFGISASF